MKNKKIYSICLLSLLILNFFIIFSKDNNDDEKKFFIKKKPIITEVNNEKIEVIEISESDNEYNTYVKLNEYEKDLLLRLSMCEAGGETLECVASVIRTVINRMESDDFPNTIYDVIYQDGQFEPVATQWINSVEPSGKCIDALNMVIHGWDETQGSLFFETATDDMTWINSNKQFLFTEGGMNFYK